MFNVICVHTSPFVFAQANTKRYAVGEDYDFGGGDGTGHVILLHRCVILSLSAAHKLK